MSDDAQVRRILDGLGVPYEIVEIDPAFADTAAFCEKYGYGLDVSGNTIIVASKKEPKQYAACLVLANTRLDVNHAVKRLMGASRVSFASADETMALTGMQIGGVGMGVMEGFASFMAEAAMKNSAKARMGDGVKIGKVSKKCAWKTVSFECSARAQACR